MGIVGKITGVVRNVYNRVDKTIAQNVLPDIKKTPKITTPDKSGYVSTTKSETGKAPDYSKPTTVTRSGGGSSRGKDRTTTSPTGTTPSIETTSSVEKVVETIVAPPSRSELAKKQFITNARTKEAYNPQLKRYVSTSPTGSSGTAYSRPPTLDEQYKIDLANKKGSISELPPVKFLSGEYGWQKTLIEKNKEKTQPKFIEDMKGKGDLMSIPYSPQALAPKEANIFFKGEKVVRDILTSRGVDTSNTIKIPKQTASDVALLVSLVAFDPLMRTGAVKKQTTSQVLSENKFSSLGKDLAKESKQAKVTEFYQGVRSELANKKAGEEQLKTLNEVYKKFFKGKEGGKEDFKVLLKKLYEEGDFKGVPANYIARPPQQQVTFVIDIKGLPQMQGTSGITSSIGATRQEPKMFNVVSQPKKQELTNVLNQNQFNDVVTTTNNSQKVSTIVGTSMFSGSKTKQGTTQELIQEQVPKQIDILGTGQVQTQVQKQAQRQVQKQIQKQIPKQKETFFKFIPKLPSSQAKRILKKVQAQPDIFESFVTKGGKEFSLGKKGTQEGAELLLKGKIISSLSAGGFITKGGNMLKATELKSFGGGEFRLSKANEFKIIERQEKRLRKGTTGKEVQYFRKGKKKKGSIF